MPTIGTKTIQNSIKISLEDIISATQNFSDDHLIGRGRFGNVYKGQVTHANGFNAIAAKRLDRLFGQGEQNFCWSCIFFLSINTRISSV
uniref:Protein kinase domain-containing protein n=1 Tax=Lactuca sativa TaxID=4236 RepID=A0A9R1XY59_LACSA|nr:hypothetical protein LSAT_V11C100034460 [Lactuca sativa]